MGSDRETKQSDSYHMTAGQSDGQVVGAERRGRSENGERAMERFTVVSCGHDACVEVQ